MAYVGADKRPGRTESPSLTDGHVGWPPCVIPPTNIFVVVSGHHCKTQLDHVTIPAKRHKSDEIFWCKVLHLVKLSPAIAATIEHEAESTRIAQVLCSPDCSWHTACPGRLNTV